MKTSETGQRPEAAPGRGHDWVQAGPCARPGGMDLTRRALSLCDLPAGSLIADIGCGAGGTLAHLERTGHYRLVGLDLSPVAPAAGGTAPAHLVGGRAEALPFRAGSFDALLCECVLSILDDRAAALDEFARVLKDGGFLVVSDLSAKGLGPRPVSCLLKGQLLDDLAARGFRLIHWEDHDRLLKEFVARMILAGVWQWRRAATKTGDLGYFLLVAENWHGR